MGNTVRLIRKVQPGSERWYEQRAARRKAYAKALKGIERFLLKRKWNTRTVDAVLQRIERLPPKS
jgi:heme-degrading monooxygenase HmoA